MISKVQVEVRDELPLVLLELSGEVTTFAEDTIMAAYSEASERGAEQILLDFSNVSYVNSAGIAVVIGLLNQARKRDQQVIVSGLSAHYTKVFHIMGLETYIQLFETPDAARRAVRSQS